MAIPLLQLGITAGEDVADRLRQALQDSDAVVVLLSEASANSPFVMNEVGAVLALNKRIVLLKVGDDPLSTSLATAHVQMLDTAGLSPEQIAASVQRSLEG
jgi:hypothetical protein